MDSKQSSIESAKNLAPLFQVSVTIRVFGHVIWSWTFPPKKGGVTE